MANKPPIINVPTTPNSAMNRAGTALKNPDLDHRMEYFDPKTRPHSIFLDEQALLATPPHLICSTAATVFASSVAAKAQLDSNPLVEGDDDQAFRLAYRACQRLPEEPDNASLRIDLGVAAFLRNRAEDDGMSRLLRGRTFSGNYAISTAIHIRYPRIGQGESTSAIHSARIRTSDTIDAPAAERVARALEAWHDGMDGRSAALAVADRLDALYTKLGMPTRVRQLEISRVDFPKIAADTVKNFNANAGARSPDAQIADALRLLEAAY
jgi:alcohol dehydrogenase class IV